VSNTHTHTHTQYSAEPAEPAKLYLNYLFPVSTRLARHDARVIPAGPPPLTPTAIRASRVCKTAAGAWRVHFEVTPSRTATYATLKVHGKDIRGWSFTEELPPRHEPHPVWEPEVAAPFFHLRRSARDDGPWTMSIDTAGPTRVEVTSTAQRRSPELEALAARLPPWVTVSTWLADMSDITWGPEQAGTDVQPC
jgi:hypothetical protein